ncbi:phosphoribosylamine--glycine ligase : Phosphoribosylamine--glycine ligase OS=Rhodopirellula sp. SWK7 GN=purD PE=3 SV=1: GARS_N: GARS_A: GARS_C [Gemmata massiliana]|uniref:Phosphoribosylamine--glycine ligase n=1 Tax=Gemmata massiliana TaxID=1210884 RepID=A0A6P2DLG1_9BACT|nr:phosphoribosylamine--glycine ligase [Gemmata massiliana]VTS03391.1 phosphoribosylamine--glycine ligase : Phosphoribosylamine--glycine ligase OS=Rhodopirellula sp. SWK7 GN=purD PE=3 SV=1: GARS_N: GARS_A: GARS_C [Gemmata massiliana]
MTELHEIRKHEAQIMNVMVIGKGGREHALAWRLKQSPRAGTIFCAPGNAGTASDGITNVAIEYTETDKLQRFCLREKIGLVVIGPEDPLAAGLADFLRGKGLKVFGPSKEAARIESSKVFAKELMRHADVPTAEFRVFDHPQPARDYIETRDYPVVVKADGLAAGKGVVVCKTGPEAVAAVRRIMTDAEFGSKAGRNVVVEKRLDGEEVSVLALVSGRTFLPLPACQDHKAVGDGDTGPNTGGMGAYCPAPIATPELMKEWDRTVFFPTIHAMKRGRYPFQGVLFGGFILTNQGTRVLEFNCRFGDPETQVVMMRLKTDLLDLLEAVADERLQEFEDKIVWDTRPAVCVVLCAGGYPGKYDNGKPITGIADADRLPDVKVFHAGTKIDERDRLVTDGGRVLGVTALGDTLADAKARAYEAVKLINFTGMHYRTDIADKALKVKPVAAPTEAPKLPAKFRKPGTSDTSGEKPAN